MEYITQKNIIIENKLKQLNMELKQLYSERSKLINKNFQKVIMFYNY